MSGRQSDRNPALDGIRGLAISLVFYHHCVLYLGLHKGGRLGAPLHSLGQSAWVGVDLFFVLSGFLITGILYEAKGTDHYFRNFYGRRSLRIFPLYYVFLTGAFLVLPVFLAPETGSALTSGQAWYWLYLSNVDVALNGWRETDYFGHFWSLAVEEQFYLLWPLVVLAASRRALLVTCGVCMAGALAFRFIIFDWQSGLGHYVLMPARMDSFAAGAIVAVLLRDPGGLARFGRLPVVMLVASAAVILGLLLWHGRLSTQNLIVGTIGFSTLAIAFASLIAVVVSAPQDSRLSRLLSSAPLIGLGKYSYAMYVFHQPVLKLMRDHGLSASQMPALLGSKLPAFALLSVAALALTLLCAIVSWRLLEAPALALKRYLPRPPSNALRPRAGSRVRPGQPPSGADRSRSAVH